MNKQMQFNICHLSTGAADDLAKVTNIARGMVMRYGIAEKLGGVSYESERPMFLNVPGQVSISASSARTRRARSIMSGARYRAVGVYPGERVTQGEGASNSRKAPSCCWPGKR
jgi:ATP-dependent Zn protease